MKITLLTVALLCYRSLVY